MDKNNMSWTPVVVLGIKMGFDPYLNWLYARLSMYYSLIKFQDSDVSHLNIVMTPNKLGKFDHHNQKICVNNQLAVQNVSMDTPWLIG